MGPRLPSLPFLSALTHGPYFLRPFAQLLFSPAIYKEFFYTYAPLPMFLLPPYLLPPPQLLATPLVCLPKPCAPPPEGCSLGCVIQPSPLPLKWPLDLFGCAWPCQLLWGGALLMLGHQQPVCSPWQHTAPSPGSWLVESFWLGSGAVSDFDCVTGVDSPGFITGLSATPSTPKPAHNPQPPGLSGGGGGSLGPGGEH